MNQLTVSDVLQLISARAQWCRENGESDMRNILNTVRAIKSLMDEGKTRTEVLAYFANDDDADADAALTAAYADGRSDQHAEDGQNAARWRMLPAFLSDHQIDYMRLLREIDGAIASATATTKAPT